MCVKFPKPTHNDGETTDCQHLAIVSLGGTLLEHDPHCGETHALDSISALSGRAIDEANSRKLIGQIFQNREITHWD
jgi:hypothetical protein